MSQDLGKLKKGQLQQRYAHAVHKEPGPRLTKASLITDIVRAEVKTSPALDAYIRLHFEQTPQVISLQQRKHQHTLVL